MKLYSTSRISRRLQERFAFKAERDMSPKSAMTRRPYPPGMHGKKRGRGLSEFGTELVEKQKIRYQYGLSDSGLRRIVEQAEKARGKTTTSTVYELLERRLDNAVFRSGLASSRRIAREIVSHGFISINGTPARIPSRLIRVGDVIRIRDEKKGRSNMTPLHVRLKTHQPPQWLTLDPEAWSATVKRLPAESDELAVAPLNKIIEFYSR